MVGKRKLGNVNRMSVSFPEDLFNLLSVFAEQRGVSLTQVIRMALYDFFQRNSSMEIPVVHRKLSAR